MEADWGRGDFVRLSLTEINDLIAPSGLVGIEAELITEGHANTNYRLSIESQAAVLLRIYQRDPQAGAVERAIAGYLGDGVPVPRILWFSEERGCCILTWLEGESIESLVTGGRSQSVLDAAESIGWTLAQISSIHFTSAGFLDGDLKVCSRWPSAADGLFDYMDHLLGLDIVRERAGTGLVRPLERISRVARVRLNALAQPPNLVHGDFKASNLLVSGGKLSGVLDWEFAHSGTWLLDAGQLFRHPLPAGFVNGFESGFVAAGGGLVGEWRELARAVDTLSLVDFLARPASTDRRIAEVRRLAGETCTALESWV